MEWFEQIKVENWTPSLTLKSEVLTMGSCFAENMGNALYKRKFNVLTNPFGIAFNPLSIFHHIDRAIQQRTFKKEELFEQEGVFHHFDVHGSFSNQDFKEMLATLNDQLIRTREMVERAHFVFFTFGTAWVYEKDQHVVANCHKADQKLFRKRLLSVEEMVEKGEKALLSIKQLNKSIVPVFSVSPVKHKKDGFTENHISKGRLLDAALVLAQKSGGNYFPGYELLTDGLRDYRFFAENKTHPSAEAIQYIWSVFAKAAFDKETQKKVAEIEKIQQAVTHRPLYAGSEKHWQFVQKTLKKIDLLENDYRLDFSLEKTQLLASTKSE